MPSHRCCRNYVLLGRAVIDGLTRVEPYFEDAVRRGRRELIPVREYLHGPFAGMLQRANSVLNGAGACILR